MRIINADVFCEDGTFEKKEITIENGRFTGEGKNGSGKTPAGDSREGTGETVLDAEGLYAIPGLVDIHFHGCMGFDFCDGTQEAMEKIAEYELSQGITSIVPATMTFSEEILSGIMECAARFAASQETEGKGHGKPCRAALRGINMEGPFISGAKKGAQNPAYIMNPDISMFERLQEKAKGLIRFCDIAPELPGSREFITKLHDKVGISLAHTTADYETAAEAFSLGARHVTHLYNAMPPFSHRAPGVAGAACDHENVRVELICDGVHIHPSVVRTTFKMFGDDRICLISDSMEAAGLPDGEYSLGGQPVKVVGNRAALKDGTIAGSNTNLMNCLRTAVLKMGIPLGSAVKCASMNPAKAAGLFDICGSIAPGKSADLLLVDRELKIHTMVFQGELL